MTAQIIDGKAFAARLRGEIAQATQAFTADSGVTPGLAVVLVGEDPASRVYVRNKGLACREAGITSFETLLPATATQAQLLAEIARLNADPAVHGILVQLPLPATMDAQAVINAIDPAKDVDGFHVINAGRLAVGQDGLVPCTPLGCLLLLKATLGSLAGKHAVILGRSNIVGKPMAQLLLRESCTVTICHSRTEFLAQETRRGDILVAAIGKPEFVKGAWVKPGATVLDVGINRITREDGSSALVGDVDTAAACEFARFITPVPGGIGPMTIACLLRNTLQAACAIHGAPFTLA
ncbi:MAG: bifunctional methylenetetrahydrofolate dehydrogenase/methenyltetrahydrofolate cyclohydrolase FolD [Alphaproteobacteria bacterium]|nr:bifunctional methylenetetrahydrofolate dehydrogenase/methenyltetrahydrofolate cyclohydrolase FolD [Alphaproteobacteria bacterium]